MAQADAAFVGQIPQLYDRLMVPMLFRPYAADMGRRLAGMASGHVLETAAGTGVVTRALAATLPPAIAITATDLNQAMLDHAAAQSVAAPGAGRVTWRQADAQKLPFADSSFDAVVCQFGVMFFPDKAAGYAEALRVLKPGGRYLFSVWSEIALSPIADIVTNTVAAQFPADPPQFLARTPHGYDDIAGIEAALAAVGFTGVQAERRTEHSCATSALAAATAFCQGSPLRGEILARDAEALHRVTDACAAALVDRFGNGAIEAPMEAIIVTASRPA